MYALPQDYTKPIQLCKGLIKGYLYFFDPHHPLSIGGGCVYLHRHEASIREGRWLTNNEYVHHKDENKLNNNHDNLEITSNPNHALYHAVKRGGLPKRIKTCPICGVPFLGLHKRLYCSNRCRGLAIRRVKRPSIHVLKQDIETMSWIAIGRKYGVSDNAVRKWAKQYGLVT